MLDIKADHVRSGDPTKSPVPVCTENLKSDHIGDEVRRGWRVN